jgi:hypothetical protein
MMVMMMMMILLYGWPRFLRVRYFQDGGGDATHYNAAIHPFHPNLDTDQYPYCVLDGVHFAHSVEYLLLKQKVE